MRAARTMSSTRAAWNPRSANTRIPASSSLRIVLRPWARSSRARGRRSRRGRDVAPAGRSSGRLVRFGHVSPGPALDDRGSRPPLRGSYRLRHAARLVAVVRRPRSHLRRGRGRPRGARRARRRRRRPRAAGRPRVPPHLRRRRQARRDHRGRERPALADANATRSSRSRGPRVVVTDRRRATGRVGRDRAARSSGCRAPRRPSSPHDPDRPVAIIFTSGTTGLPEGRALLQPPARVHHADRRRRHVGRRRALVQRHVVRAPRVHDQAARQPPPRRHDVHHGALARARRARAARPRTHDDGRGRADAARAHAARPEFDAFDLSIGAVHHRGRRPDHARARRRGAPAVRRARSRRATRAPKPASGSAPRSTTPTRTRSSASAARTRASSSSLRDADGRPVSGARRRRGVPALPRGDVGLLARSRSRPRAAFTADGFVRTGDLGWVDDRGRLRLVGRSKEMYVRGGYNVYPVEVESVLSTHPDVAASRSCRAPTT